MQKKRKKLRALVLLGIPSAVLLLCVWFVLSHLLRSPAAPAAETPPPAKAEKAAAMAPAFLSLSAYSTSGDLYAVIKDVPPDTRLSFSLVTPEGAVLHYPVGESGTLYLSALEPGLYTVRLDGDARFAALPAAVEVFQPAPRYAPPQGAWTEADGQRYYQLDDGSYAVGLKRIDGKLYYFNYNGVLASRLGLDISYHNKGVNWQAVKADGIDFVILRLGYRGWESGLLWEDNRFDQNLRAAKAAGLDVGVYLYSTAVNPAEARREADFVVGLLRGAELQYPVYFDTEQSGEYPNGRADRLNKAQRESIFRAFCERIREGGYTPAIYSGQNFLRNHIDPRSYGRYSVWLASYTKYNQLPSFPYPFDMWQFTDSGRVSGIRGVVDMNAIFDA